jgi:putative two-component system response regulator
MIVDDNVTNLKIGKNALPNTYDVFTIPSAAKMFDLMARKKPDLILLDVDMPDMDGFEALKILRSKLETKDIPVIFLTALDHPDHELKGLGLGAIDYITKPFQPALLRKRVEVHLTLSLQKLTLESQRLELENYNQNLRQMVDEKTSKVLELQIAILKTMADLVESRDLITGEHMEQTQKGLGVMIEGLVDLGLFREELQSWNIDLLLESSLLHDVGKIAISDSILKKPAPLTALEFEEMKKHTIYGVKIIEKIQAYASESDFLQYAKIMAGTHHEKWDGSGYPDGLIGEDIPLKGRLMAIADVYDALVAVRPYKKAFSKTKAIEIIISGRGTHFDPVLTDVFQQVCDKF